MPRVLFLNKLLPIVFLPVGFAVVMLVVALWRKQRWPVVVALAVLYLSSCQFFSRKLLGALERSQPAVRIDEAGPADAVVVLGGIFSGPRLGDGFVANTADSAERLEAGIQLQLHHRVEWLIFTGGRIPWEGREVVEGEDSRRVALARGVPAEKVLITREVGNTWDEARALADLMKQRGWKKVILVTSAWHMPRSARLFRAAKVEFIPFPVDYRIDPKRPTTLLDFLPKAEALQETDTALREVYGWLFYAATGR
jgi:uncharacterized SAM-binding protein YcdF (DUF218 family)